MGSWGSRLTGSKSTPPPSCRPRAKLTARFEGEYDLRITNRLILQPRVEFNVAAQNVPKRGIGAGLSSAEAGLRLRYELTPLFAPYVGVEVERAFGETADYRRREGEDRDSTLR